MCHIFFIPFMFLSCFRNFASIDLVLNWATCLWIYREKNTQHISIYIYQVVFIEKYFFFLKHKKWLVLFSNKKYLAKTCLFKLATKFIPKQFLAFRLIKHNFFSSKSPQPNLCGFALVSAIPTEKRG